MSEPRLTLRQRRARLVAKREREARDAILPAHILARYQGADDDVLNIGFAGTLEWLASRIEIDRYVVTPEWLRDEATRTYQMIADHDEGAT